MPTIQWFPGHMHVTRKALAERLAAGIDVVIELLDARLPGSSANPLLAELGDGRPTLKILNKQDLADPRRTASWLAHYAAIPGTRAIALDAGEAAPAQRLVDASRGLAPLRGGMVKPLRLLICGVPNVGKSTLVNTLASRRATKTGDEAGITRVEQRIALASDVLLYDTPGLLWPKIVVPESGLHLAAAGAVGRNAFDEMDVALALIERLQADYPGALRGRYAVDDAQFRQSDDALEAIGRARGAVVKGGRVDLQKAAEAVLHDFRSGSLGRITLETPEQFSAWRAAAQDAEAARPPRRKRP